MALIDLDKFVASFITEIKKNHMVITYNIPSCIKKALEDQGLEYKDGEIVKSQRRVSAESKENGYGESEDERIRKEIKVILANTDFSQFALDYTFADMLAWLEKQGKQNHSEQDLEMVAKPKFNIGDWITHNIANFVFKVVSVGSYGYEVVNRQNFKKTISLDSEDKYHLWSVEDAKDGDVLHSTGWHNDCIFIFNCLDNWKFDEPNGDRAVATGYCCLSVSADNMEFGIQGPDCVEVNTIKPATKIQRDLLFQKMKEAGYEWDAEKKELKLLITNGGDFSETENCGQKPVEWKQENREELTEFENAMMHIGGSFFGENAGLDPNDTDTIKEQAELLLELAPKQEWSEEDEDILNTIINHFEIDLECTKNDDIIRWLKSLKPQNKWKPSDEQIHAFEQVYDWYNNNFAPSETLTSFYNDLKKLKE